MKTVALIEFNWRGHNPSYYRLYCDALLGLGHRVIAFCPQPELLKQWYPAFHAAGQLQTEELHDEVLKRRWVRKVPQLAGVFRFKQHAAKLARWEAASGERIDLALFACLYDGIAPWGGMDAIFPYRWTSLLLDSGCVRLPNGPRRWLRYRGFNPLALFRASGCLSFANLDNFIVDALRRRTGKPVCVLPEVADNSPPRADFPLAEEIRRQAAGRRIVGCFGQFARRKGALGFLRLAEACRDEPWFFTWVGPLEENSFSKAEMRWLRAFLKAQPPNCRVELTRVADGPDFNALVALSDALCLCYHQHIGSSNMISKAVAFEKPIAVSDGYCMADQTRRYHLGLCVPEDDSAATHVALRQLLAPDGNLPPPRYTEFRADNSTAAFAEAIHQMMGG